MAVIKPNNIYKKNQKENKYRMEAEKVKKAGSSNLKRVSSALIGFPLVALIVIIGNKYMISVGLAIIAILSMHEYLHAVSKKANPIKWISYLSCALISLISFVIL